LTRGSLVFSKIVPTVTEKLQPQLGQRKAPSRRE